MLPLIRPRAGYWIAKTLVGGGVAVLVAPWWLPLVEAVLDKTFGVTPNTGSTTIGFVLIAVGLIVFGIERRKDWQLDSFPELVVRAHFAYLMDGTGIERCFIKISNGSPSKPTTVTHIDYMGSSHVPILTVPLPRRLEASEMFEVHIPLSALPDTKSDQMLSKFCVTDSTGSQFWAIKNESVSPVGYVA